MKRIMLAAIGLMAIISSCKKTDATTSPGTSATETLIAPMGFNFSTTKEVSLRVQLLTNDNKPISGVPVNVFSTNNTTSALFTAVSDENGYVSGVLNIPAYTDSLIIDPAYIGLMRNALAVIHGSTVTGVIGGSKSFGGDIVANDNQIGSTLRSTNTSRGGSNSTIYTYLGTYDYLGGPNYVLSTSDVISSQLLSFINTSLPEQKPVNTYHPDYLSANATTNLNIVKTSDVWVTFVSEGAGYYNSLGFYKYKTGTPPQTPDDIDSIKIAMPNASLWGSGGSMSSGDKIYLGRFTAGTSIGFVLFQNAWSSSKRQVVTTATKYYSDDNLNNENTGYKRHAVMLYDSQNKLFLHGFEDQQRDNGTADHDFNDLIFYTTSNPVDGISYTAVNPIDKPTDTDGDGVSDVYDKFPKDATRAYIQYFPTQDTWGTLAFEDLWPSVGDYDLNDLVLGYHYTFINNAANKTVEINADYVINGMGAANRNGFGVQLPFTPDKVSAVTGQKLTANYIRQNTNGTEASQSNTVIIPFDDPKSLISDLYVNTVIGQPYYKSDTSHVKITLSTALAAADLGTAPFNPFLILNQQRGYEVHLPGLKPTDKADTKLFGTSDDRTSAATNKYYLNQSNWPWALNFVEPFDYPTEGNNISKVYTYFLSWAQSGGATNADWYKNTTGNRNDNLIYKH
jgi:LruC domain-containing protein